MFEFLVGLATIASCIIAYVTLKQQKNFNESNDKKQRNTTEVELNSPAVAKGLDRSKPANQIPEGITFGSKVVVIPGYDAIFWNRFERVVDLMEGQYYRWVQRGDPIGEFRIDGSFGASSFVKLFSPEQHIAVIRSPVSGLLIYSEIRHNIDYEEWNSLKKPSLANCAILLPDDEPKPETGEYIYSAMCQLARDKRQYQLRSSRVSPDLNPSSKEFNETQYLKFIEHSKLQNSQFNEILKSQIGVQPRIFDALPSWGEYFDEARTKYPELRPYLKHLR